mmetsp:Transcript_49180/g.81754  ORF Transcript_49180/g.81754 Transcript_49180/m.81754 type:complete len:294 (+) Transcript_49180:399-1280(+)
MLLLNGFDAMFACLLQRTQLLLIERLRRHLHFVLNLCQELFEIFDARFILDPGVLQQSLNEDFVLLEIVLVLFVELQNGENTRQHPHLIRFGMRVNLKQDIEAELLVQRDTVHVGHGGFAGILLRHRIRVEQPQNPFRHLRDRDLRQWILLGCIRTRTNAWHQALHQVLSIVGERNRIRIIREEHRQNLPHIMILFRHRIVIQEHEARQNINLVVFEAIEVQEFGKAFHRTDEQFLIFVFQERFENLNQFTIGCRFLDCYFVVNRQRLFHRSSIFKFIIIAAIIITTTTTTRQ